LYATWLAAGLILFGCLALLARQAVARFSLRLARIPVAPPCKRVMRRVTRTRLDQGRRWR
jgi:hypothetical protein